MFLHEVIDQLITGFITMFWKILVTIFHCCSLHFPRPKVKTLHCTTFKVYACICIQGFKLLYSVLFYSILNLNICISSLCVCSMKGLQLTVHSASQPCAEKWHIKDLDSVILWFKLQLYLVWYHRRLRNQQMLLFEKFGSNWFLVLLLKKMTESIIKYQNGCRQTVWLINVSINCFDYIPNSTSRLKELWSLSTRLDAKAKVQIVTLTRFRSEPHSETKGFFVLQIHSSSRGPLWARAEKVWEVNFL